MKEIYKNLSLLIIVLIFIFLIFEIYFRFTSVPNQTQFDPFLGMSIRPNTNLHFKTTEFETDYISNSYGFRDSEHSLEKDETVFRIAVIGDSFTEAIQVNQEKRFDKLIEKYLTEKSNKTVEILNFGTGGWGTDQEILAYKTKIKQFNPDLVILMFVYNDFQDNTIKINKPYHTLDAGSLVYHPAKFSYNPTLRKVLSYSAFLTQMANYAYKIKMRSTSKKSLNFSPATLPYALAINWPQEEWSTEVQEAVIITSALLANLSKEIEQNEAQFLLVSVPPAPAIESLSLERFKQIYPNENWKTIDFSQQEKILLQIASENHFAFVGLYNPFIKYKQMSGIKYKQTSGEQLYFYKDEHWNEKGHLLAATAILQKLSDLIN